MDMRGCLKFLRLRRLILMQVDINFCETDTMERQVSEIKKAFTGIEIRYDLILK